jgi:ATP-dependent helicase YprA (DUF1998 family)
MAFSPVEASKKITTKYLRYLNTIFNIADKQYNSQFENLLHNQKSFAVGPFLDVSDSFEKGKSLFGFMEDGTLPKGFSKLRFPLERELYKHQEEAILKVIGGKNLIVSTGTGSGKTESFLIPILRDIINEYENNLLGPGIRAMIIYPMNALANDQLERLRDILAEFPEITYGSYTGQTKNSEKHALAEYKDLNDGATPHNNELISRDQMKKTPPHILITNYAMLEYLMLRPGDSIFFSPEYSNLWRYVVLDEAHVYNGSTGIEVSMLLRRLKATLQNEKIQYILTSATLGSENENAEVARFASDLCDSTFDQSDVVRAKRITLELPKQLNNLGVGIYNTISRVLDSNYSEAKTFEDIQNLISLSQAHNKLSELLYDYITHDELFWRIRKTLVTPKTVSSLAKELELQEGDIADFVSVASKAEKNGERPFDARYHMFLRATESVFITLEPSRKLFLSRKESHIETDGKDYKVFEIATCSSCHGIYLMGKIDANGCLSQCNYVEPYERSVFLLSDSISNSDEDNMMEDEEITADNFEICSRCGFVRRMGGTKKTGCEHDAHFYRPVVRVDVKNETGKLTKCISCEAKNNFGVLRTFFTGQEAVTSVIGTALFEVLPSYKIIVEDAQIEDDSGFGFATSQQTNMTQEAKQFIAFSDNRQAAAFYATYLGQTYTNILYKRIVVEALKEIRDSQKANLFIDDLTYFFEKYNISKDTAQKEAWKALLAEMVDNKSRTSLYSMGMIGFGIDPTNVGDNKKLNLTAQEVATLCSVFVLDMMSDAAIIQEGKLNQAEKDFYLHNGVEYAFNLSDSDRKRQMHSFIPVRENLNNKRLDYFVRVMNQKGLSLEREDTIRYLMGIWNNIFIGKQIMERSGSGYRLNLKSVVISGKNDWYLCKKCMRITMHNIDGVCPTYHCDGELVQIDTTQFYVDNHYYEMYQNLDIRELKVVEHTAQLNKETAYDYQKQFKKKEIDVLSCSTTFEMGVDVGTLETVFMRNMPPSPSNYAQRAGRAGRSRDSAAFALTFCTKSNHDFTFFKQPTDMIRGKISSPKFNVENEKIAIRHLYASALSMFWKEYPEYFDRAAKMTEKQEDGLAGYEVFTDYLLSSPEKLKEFANKFLPKTLIDKFDVEHFGWLESLLSKDESNPGVLTKAIEEYKYEVGILEAAREEGFKANQRVDYLAARIRVYQKEDILSFLSKKNVLPKYGFPVDTVEMSVLDISGKTSLGLELSRDLSIAIAEYAPGSQIIANGNLITSRYIRKIPRMSWKMYDYIWCPKCSTLNIETHIGEGHKCTIDACKQCYEPLIDKTPSTFLIPSFGFEADGEKIEKPKLIKPEKTFRSEVAYVGYGTDISIQRQMIGNAAVEVSFSKADEMAVLNESAFYVCETCGYTDLDPKWNFDTKTLRHKLPNGYWCKSEYLRKYALGYRFETDVIQIRFLNPDIYDRDIALSVLYAVLKGACTTLNIEQSDIAGCLQYFYNDISNRANYALVLYDKTPGGAGYVRQLCSAENIELVLRETLRMIKNCDCGGETMDSSCYSCLRTYYNQKQHDILKRKYVVEYLGDFLE